MFWHPGLNPLSGKNHPSETLLRNGFRHVFSTVLLFSKTHAALVRQPKKTSNPKEYERLLAGDHKTGNPAASPGTVPPCIRPTSVAAHKCPLARHKQHTRRQMPSIAYCLACQMTGSKDCTLGKHSGAIIDYFLNIPFIHLQKIAFTRWISHQGTDLEMGHFQVHSLDSL